MNVEDGWEHEVFLWTFRTRALLIKGGPSEGLRKKKTCINLITKHSISIQRRRLELGTRI